MVLINQFINFKIGGVTVAANSTELNYNAGVTAGTALASKTLVLDASKNITGINALTATTFNGTIGTASQPNITSLGTLTTLKVSGSLDIGISGSGIIRQFIFGNNIYFQPALTATTGSATHLFITNYGQSTSTSARVFSIMSDGKVGIQSINPSKQLEINSATGANLRLTYNNMNGTATNYTDLSTNSSGNMTITTSGDLTTITKKLKVSGAINNFAEGGLMARSFNYKYMLGKVIQQEVITTLNLPDYNPAGQADDFSVEIYGFIKPLYSQIYTFYINWNNGLRLFINGTLLFNKWQDGGDQDDIATDTIALTANIWYPIYIQHYDATGGSDFRIQWQSTSQIKQDIPSTSMAWSNKEPAAFNNGIIGGKLTLFNDNEGQTSSKFATLSVNTADQLTIKPHGDTAIIDASDINNDTILKIRANDDSILTIRSESGVSTVHQILQFDSHSASRGGGIEWKNDTNNDRYFFGRVYQGGGSISKLTYNVALSGEDPYRLDSNVDVLVIQDDGKIGINEQSPHTLLHITNTSADSVNSTLTLESKDNTNGSGLSIDFINNGSSAITGRINNIKYGGGDYGLSFSTHIGSLTEYLVLRNGRMGVGTNNPAELLHLKSTGPVFIKLEADTDNTPESDTAGIFLTQDGGVVTSIIALEGINNTIATGSIGNSLVINTSHSTQSLQLGTQDIIRATIKSTGEFGIGAILPVTPLHVHNAISSANIVTISDPDNTNKANIAFDPNGDSWFLGARGSANSIAPNCFYVYGAGYYKLVIDPSGFVGLNTTNPEKQLEINSATGNNLRLTYNDNTGSAANYTDFKTDSSGRTIIESSSGKVGIHSINIGDNVTKSPMLQIMQEDGYNGVGEPYQGEFTALRMGTNKNNKNNDTITSFVFDYDYNQNRFTHGKFHLRGLQSSAAGSNGITFETSESANWTPIDGITLTFDGSEKPRVGIGASSPGSTLEIQDTAPEIRLTDDRTSSGGSSGLDLGKISFYSLDATSPDLPVAQIQVTANNTTIFPDGDIRLKTAINGTLTDTMIVTANNTVGINTTSPGGVLHVSQSGGSASMGRFENTTVGATSYLDIRNQAGTRCIIGADGSGLLNFSTDEVVISNWTDNKIRFVTNATSRMVLDQDNLGIGTSFPSEKLHIKSPGPALIKIEGDSDNSNEADIAGIHLSQDGGGIVAKIQTTGAADNDPYTGVLANGLVLGCAGFSEGNIHFATETSVKMSIATNGNVGIGKNNPSFPLEIVRTGINTDLRILRTDANGIDFRLKAQDSRARMTYENGPLWIDYNNVGGLTMAMTETGNVGIGEVLPHTKLHVTNTSADSANSTLTLESKDNTNGSGLSIDFINNGSSAITGRINNIKYGSGDYGLSFSTHIGSLTEYLVLRNGRMGIGTNNPTEMLHLKSLGSIFIKLESDTNNTPESDNAGIIMTQDNGAQSAYIRFEGIAETTATGSLQDSLLINCTDEFANTVSSVQLATESIVRLTVANSGKIGIGINAPESVLHIQQSANDITGGIRIENTTGNRWTLHQSGFKNLIFSEEGNLRGYLATGVDVDTIDFTGQHRNISDNEKLNGDITDYIGLIVYATGEYQNINNGDLHINEALPKVDLSNIYKDKRVFGVISDKEESDEERTFANGAFVSVLDKEDGDERLIINSVGEGMIWICDKNGPIENGDLITSSDAAGYGCKQNTVYICNYTVGKITQDCDFSEPERFIDLEGNIIDQSTYDSNPDNGYKCCFVGCVYYCG